MAVQYKLYYFPLHGRCEFIRYIFAYANVPYEDNIITFNEWRASKKAETPMGVLPVLELENGVKLSQSLAIGRYLATKFGLASQDELENAWGEQIAGAIEDVYVPHFRPWVYAFFDKDEAKMKEKWIELEKNGLIPLFERLEKMLGDKTWFCGENIHWADLYVAEFIDRLKTATALPENDVASKFPRLVAHCRRVHEIPNIKKYAQTKKLYPY